MDSLPALRVDLASLPALGCWVDLASLPNSDSGLTCPPCPDPGGTPGLPDCTRTLGRPGLPARTPGTPGLPAHTRTRGRPGLPARTPRVDLASCPHSHSGLTCPPCPDPWGRPGLLPALGRWVDLVTLSGPWGRPGLPARTAGRPGLPAQTPGVDLVYLPAIRVDLPSLAGRIG